VVRREASKAARSIGVEAEGNMEGCLSPQPTRGSGKSRKLPQYGPGRSPPGRQKTGFGAFRALKTHVLRRKCSIFDIFLRSVGVTSAPKTNKQAQLGGGG